MDLELNVGLTLDDQGVPKYTTTIKRTRPATYPMLLVTGNTIEESVNEAKHLLTNDGYQVVAVHHIEY